MALDSRENRASAVSLFSAAPPSVTPLASPDQAWRQEAAWCYAGILVAAPAAIPALLLIGNHLLNLLMIRDEAPTEVLIGDDLITDLDEYIKYES